MAVVELNGARINYLQINCESKTSKEELVMVHGLATNMAFWFHPYTAELAKYFRITLYDLRGHGRSGITDSGYSAASLSTDLELLLAHLNITRAHFLVHSFGGVIALKLAIRKPELFASLILADTQLSLFRACCQSSQWVLGQQLVSLLKQHKIDLEVDDPYFGFKLLTLFASLDEQKTTVSRQLQNLLKPLLGKLATKTAGRWLKLIRTTQAEKELMINDQVTLKQLQSLTFPVLTVYGELSQALNSGQQLTQICPDANFKLIPQAGHFFPKTQPQTLIYLACQFWHKTSLI